MTTKVLFIIATIIALIYSVSVVLYLKNKFDQYSISFQIGIVIPTYSLLVLVISIVISYGIDILHQ